MTAATRAVPHQELAYRIIGCAMEAHNRLGPGLKEKAYQRALSHAMERAGLSFEAEKPLEVTFDGTRIGRLIIDHLVEDSIVVEEKALSHLLTNDEVAQVVTYLAATGAPIGLLLNVGRPRLQYRRILPPRKLDLRQDRVRRYVRTSRR